jgi:hypothetical protein
LLRATMPDTHRRAAARPSVAGAAAGPPGCDRRSSS